MDDDVVFRALADPTRRRLLDKLYTHDGQNLTELCTGLEMTRFGARKHLLLLEDAGLVVSIRKGRERRHYLNPVPIQMVYERWVSKYARPWAHSLLSLKKELEAPPMSDSTQHVLRIYIKSTPERIWQALTDGSMTERYYFASRAESTWKAGAPYRNVMPDGFVMLSGEVIAAEPPRRLVQTFNPGWVSPEEAGPTSQVEWEIEPMGDVCRVTLTHSGLVPGSPLTEGFFDGWSQILSGLKSLLETGEPIVIPPTEGAM